jgi:hypothetical protein
MCIALATYSCRDSCGVRRKAARTAFPQGPFPGTGAIMEPGGAGFRRRRYANRALPPSRIAVMWTLCDGLCGLCIA